jgi:hypothetical protein
MLQQLRELERLLEDAPCVNGVTPWVSTAPLFPPCSLPISSTCRAVAGLPLLGVGARVDSRRAPTAQGAQVGSWWCTS